MSSKLRNAIRAVNRSRVQSRNRSTVTMSLSALAAMGMAGAVAAQEPAAVLEEVVITGYKSSLMQSMEVKRFNNAVVDAVTAEDIGKFPDKNVAESLSRIPGIAISRDFGEGQGVTIRGLAPGLNITQVNGQAVGTAQWFVLADAERNFNYEMLSSEMVGSIEVYKSAQADIDEGGLGGTVILNTRQPLSLPANTFNASVEGQYSELPEEWDPSVSAMYSWKNDDETIGALLAVSHQERTVRRESTEMFPAYFNPFSDRDEGFRDALAAPEGAEGKGMVPWGVGSALFQQERERNGVDFNFQFNPNEKLETSFHYFFSELKADNQNQNFIGIPFRGLFAADNPSTGTVENGVVTDLQVRGGDPAVWANHVAFDSIFRDGSSMETEIIDLEGTYHSEKWSLHGQIGTTTGEGTNNDELYEFFAYSKDERINFDYTNPGGTSPSIDWSPSPWLTNPTDEMLLTTIRDQTNKQKDEEDYIQADLTLEVEFGAISELKFGAKYRSREFSQNRYLDELSNTVVGDVSQSLGTAGEFAAGTYTVDHDETSQGTLTHFDVNESAMRTAFRATATCGSGGLGEGDVCVTRGQFLDESSFGIEEDITAAYAMANFEGERYRGNVGLRYVQTDTTSNAYDLSAPVLTPVSDSGDYSELLPSMNLVFDMTDDVLLRVAAGKALARPAPFQLTSAVNLTVETSSGTTGNPGLEPLTANQYELGLEWYYGEGSMLSGTFFKKDIENFIFNTTTSAVINGQLISRLTRPENGPSAGLEGIELILSHSFENGFGFSGNYTYTDIDEAKVQSASLEGGEATLTETEVPFPFASESLYNLTGFYETDRFSARVSYSYRDEFFREVVESGELWGDEQEQWDAQVSYNINDNFSIRAEGLNLTEESIDSIYKAPQGQELTATQFYNGRRFVLGVNYTY
ncbi:MAG: TonB-dependent receptor [Halioglobus sp.]